MQLKTVTGITRFIRQGHACLGVSDPAGLTLTAGDGNHSLLWSRNAGQGSGNTHVWSPYGKGETTDGLPGFNGERPDPVSGSYHLGNGYRAYNPLLRRFNCPDSLSPFGAGGINPYAYCLGDPVNRTDPTGHISWQGVVGIVTGAIGLGLSLFTAGTSIAAAGSMTAALSSVSRLGLAIGLMGMAADVTAIASGAAEDVDPQASAVLGWVSMATGIAGMGIGLAQISKGVKAARSTGKSQGNRESHAFGGHLMGVVDTGGGKYSIQGYTDNFRGLGKVAIIAHGSAKSSELNFGGFFHKDGSVIGGSVYRATPTRLVEELKKIKIDLTKRTDELYLVSCFANKRTAQELANAANRPVIGFSHRSVYISYKNGHELLYLTQSQKPLHWENPLLIIKEEPHWFSLANLLGDKVKARPTTFFPNR